jgi:hypothetical protein
MYRTGTIISANCMNLFLQNLESDLINVGFVNVSSGLLATNTSGVSTRWDVMKSPGANNSIANDWFLFLGTDNATNTTLYTTISCGWNAAASNQATQYICANNSAGALNVAANGFCTIAFANTVNTGNVFTMNTVSMATTVAGMNFYYSVTIDRAIFSVANAASLNTGTCFYCGTYDSFMPLSVDTYPLVAANLSSIILFADIGSAGPSGFPNEPYYIANNTSAKAVNGNFYGAVQGFWTEISSLDGYLGGRYSFCRSSIQGHGTVAGAGNGGIRGLLKDYYVSTIQAGRGDLSYFTFNGTQYNLINLGNGSQISSQPLPFSPASWGGWVLQI